MVRDIRERKGFSTDDADVQNSGNAGSGDEFSDAVDDTMAPIKLECPIPDCTTW